MFLFCSYVQWNLEGVVSQFEFSARAVWMYAARMDTHTHTLLSFN